MSVIIVGCGLVRLSTRLEIVGFGYIKNSRLRFGYAVMRLTAHALILAWQKFENKEYHFNSDYRKYDIAKQTCEHMGGKLAEPRKQTTNDFFTDVAKKKGIAALLIGINDLSEEGEFVYIRGHPYST